MTRDAESLRASLSHLNVHSTGHLFKELLMDKAVGVRHDHEQEHLPNA